jgi:NTE family protein
MVAPIRIITGTRMRTPERLLRGEATMPDLDLLSPVSFVPGDEKKPIEDGIAVCLSGGGYRAMLFHTGVLWRLLEFGLLSPGARLAKRPDGTSVPVGTFKRISSVSGGSIISGMLGHKWKSLDFTSPATLVATYQSAVVKPIRDLASTSLASGTLEGAIKVLADIVAPGSVNEHLARAYDKHLFHKAQLNALPAEPRWVINAANLQSGALWRFMSPYMRDWKVGENRHTHKVSIAQAVAASSAFPPVLAPATFEFEDGDFTPGTGGQGADHLQRPPYTTDVQLADGGVYDNLGLETAYKRYRTLLVSDAGAPFKPLKDVPTNWAGLGKRVIDVVDNQVRALRKRLLLNALVTGTRRGAFWAIDADIASLTAPGALPCPHAQTLRLAGLGTDLGEKDDRTQERLINWGYALCDASVRTWFDTSLPPPGDFPYPGSAV